MKTPSLERRLTLSATALLAVAVIAVDTVVYLSVSARIYEGLERRLDARAQVARDISGDPQVLNRLRGETPALSDAELRHRLSGDGVSVELSRPQKGFTVVGGRLGGRHVGFVAPFGFENWRVLRESGRMSVTIWFPGLSRIVTLSVSTADAKEQLSRLRVAEIVGSLALLLVGVYVVSRLIGLAFAPLARISEVAMAIADGEHGRRLEPTRQDTQLGRLAKAFDDMVDALEDSAARTRRFVADASHELRTPVAGLQAGLELALASRGFQNGDERLVVELLRDTRRLGRLVDDLLSVARLDEGVSLTSAPYDLIEVVRQELERARARAGDVSITLSALEVCALEGDSLRVAQIIGNLLENACRATPAGGRIAVTIRERHGSVQLAVTDTGPGIPAGERDRIFERFARLDDARTQGGTGLGLTIARGFAQAHGGSLYCRDVSEGACFVLSLPRTSVAALSP